MGLLDGFLTTDSQLTWLAASKTTISEAFEKARRDNLEYVEKYQADYLLRLGKQIMKVCETIARTETPHPLLVGAKVTCPHSDAIRSDQSLLFHMGCELHLCDECHGAMIAEMKLSTMPYDERCPITGKVTTVHAPMPGLFD